MTFNSRERDAKNFTHRLDTRTLPSVRRVEEARKDQRGNVRLRSSACSRPPSRQRCPRRRRRPPRRSRQCWAAISSPGGGRRGGGEKKNTHTQHVKWFKTNSCD